MDYGEPLNTEAAFMGGLHILLLRTDAAWEVLVDL